MPLILCAFAFCTNFAQKGQRLASLVAFLLASLAGLLALLPATFLQTLILHIAPRLNHAKTFLGAFANCLVINGLIEEGAKTLLIAMLPVKKLCGFGIKKTITNHKLLLILGFVLGISFSCIEHTVYLVATSKTSFFRLFATTILHATTALLCAEAVYRAKNAFFAKIANVAKANFTHTALCALQSFFNFYNCKTFIFSIFLHALYNFFAIMPSAFFAISFLCLAFAIYLATSVYKSQS